MSASLVGSEMCIRDSSLHHRHRWQTAGASLASRWHTTSSAPVGRSLAGTCLLYTSDAADDM
eukprot:9376407-Alexandrium_andersonii.AAC.1